MIDFFSPGLPYCSSGFLFIEQKQLRMKRRSSRMDCYPAPNQKCFEILSLGEPGVLFIVSVLQDAIAITVPMNLYYSEL